MASLAPASSAAEGEGDQAWECADCGWSISGSQLLPGWSLDEARITHSERYCARPPPWPLD
jgi:ribosomal protein L37AE/L43A